jgi:16S rRNA (uracil1498-N3)-methyltransferase
LKLLSEPRFYCPELAAGVVTLDETESRHALTSLRLRPGDAVDLFDGRGRVAQGNLLAENDRSTTGPVHPGRGKSKGKRPARLAVDAVLNVPKPVHQLTLLVAAPKGPRLDWMMEKCTELGVDRLLITTFERSIVRPEPESVERLTRLTIAACKQSRRAWLPTVHVAASLLSALTLAESSLDENAGEESSRLRLNANPARRLLIADFAENAAWLAAWLHGHGPLPLRLSVVIGPEGGLTDAERETLRTAGGQTVRLAEHVLRIETAAICIAANWAARAHE